MLPQVWCEPCEVAIAPGPCSRLQRLISAATRSSATLRVEVRPRRGWLGLCGFRSAVGWKPRRFRGGGGGSEYYGMVFAFGRGGGGVVVGGGVSTGQAEELAYKRRGRG